MSDSRENVSAEADSQAQPNPVDVGAAGEGTGQGGNSEAAKYRRRLREAETARDGMAERLSVLQRREVERYAGDFLAEPADLWLTGAELAGLLDDDGNVDPGKVAEVAKGITQEKPHWRLTPTTVDKDQGQRGGPPPTSWAKILGRR